MSLSIPSILFLCVIFLICRYSGSIEYIENGLLRNFEISKNSVYIIIIFSFIGISKSAMFPLYKWLPSSMIAPTPVSGILMPLQLLKVVFL